RWFHGSSIRCDETAIVGPRQPLEDRPADWPDGGRRPFATDRRASGRPAAARDRLGDLAQNGGRRMLGGEDAATFATARRRMVDEPRPDLPAGLWQQLHPTNRRRGHLQSRAAEWPAAPVRSHARLLYLHRWDPGPAVGRVRRVD